MKISEKGIELIISFEGFSKKACKCVPTEKYYTIGYGHYGKDVASDATITKKEGNYMLQDVCTTITNVGFPIACCIFLALYIRENQKQHKEEINALTDKLNKQTLTVQKLVDKIEELLRGLTNENK